MRKNWPYTPNTSKSNGREASRPAGEIWVGFKIFKFLYRLKYLDFYFVYYHCNVTRVLGLHFGWLLSSKAYFEMCFEVRKTQ